MERAERELKEQLEDSKSKKLKIESSRQTDRQRLALLELLTEPKNEK